MKAFKSVLMAGAAIGFLAAGSASADTIRISSWAPPSHPINSQMWPQWGECLKKESNGALDYKIEYNLASPPRQFDVARRGVADAAWIFHGYTAGRFVAAEVVEIPGLGVDAEKASIAYWRTYEKYLKKANEYRGVKLIGLMSHGPAVMQTRRPITKLADLKGLKLRLPGGVASQVFGQLGVVSVKVPAPKVYEVLSTGVADGVSMPIETQKSFRLSEVAKNVIIMPGGFYYGAFAQIMSPRKYDSLNAAGKAAVDKCSGENLSRIAGKAWKGADDAGIAEAKAKSTVTTAPADIQAAVKAAVAKVEADWIKRVAKKGVDGKAALTFIRAEVNNIK